MPIIGQVGRRSFKVRALNVAIHLVLMVGAITMIYPFTIMVSGSFKSVVDSKEFSAWPRYFTNDEMLFRKYVEVRYNESSATMVRDYANRFLAFDDVTVPPRLRAQGAADWWTFLQETGPTHDIFDFVISEQYSTGIHPRNNRAFRAAVKDECGGDVHVYNRKYGAAILYWDEILISIPDVLHRRFTGDYRGMMARYRDFARELPLWHRVYASLDGHFVENELKPAYRGSVEELNKATGTAFPSWEQVCLARRAPDGPLREHWISYVQTTLNIQHVGVDEAATPAYRAMLRERYGDIDMLNQAYQTDYAGFDDVHLPTKIPASGAMTVDWGDFVENEADPSHLSVKSVAFDYRDWLKRKYEGDLPRLNRAHGRGFTAFPDVQLLSGVPSLNLAERKDWNAFARFHARPESLGLRTAYQPAFVEFLATQFPADGGGIDPEACNRACDTRFDDEANVYPARLLPDQAHYRRLWIEYVRGTALAQDLSIDVRAETPAWHAYLAEKYGTIDALNRGYGAVYEDFDSLPLGQWSNDHFVFQEHRQEIFREFFKRNYVMVLDVMLYNGRALLNTLIYCALSIMTALLINPIAAYAMSRFRLPTTYKIILILMLTMAFPPMVMGIPNFLILKKFNMLNTFWALVLPGAANGYFIFLLKGFFDSLPQELFECATIDGASEWTIFWRIAMSLSKPIMAVIALNAFNIAYRNFMLAFIVCQDKRMWTMMVHIYQLMQRSSQGVGFAALVIAAIPVFLVFVFCQNIIIRGIVVPTEK